MVDVGDDGYVADFHNLKGAPGRPCAVGLFNHKNRKKAKGGHK